MHAPAAGFVERLLVYPRSGYTNRLQAIASSEILARQLGARFQICWEPEEVVPGDALETFTDAFCDEFVLNADQVHRDYGFRREDLPRYLNVDPTRRLVVLAGHDRGEQVFMSELSAALTDPCNPTTLVIIAGGQFFLPPEGKAEQDWQAEFRELRRRFYKSLPLNAAIEDSARGSLAGRVPFLGLHLRYSDRAHQAPLEDSIRKALIEARAASGLSSVFIASDTATARTKWVSECKSLGLNPWFIEQDSWDRSKTGSGHAALVDWRVLGHSQRLVYFSESTFAVEAAVAAGAYDRSIPLAPHPRQAAAVKSRELIRAAVTYPKRHGWFSSQ